MNKTQINRQGIKTLLFALVISIVLVSCLASCSARKVSKLQTKTTESETIENKVFDSSKVTTILDLNTKIVDLSTSNEVTIEPVDNTKEMVVNGEKYFNVKLATKKFNTNKVTAIDKKASVIAQNNVKTNSKANKVKTQVVEIKKSDKKQFNFLNLWWLLLLIPIYILWKKYRGLMPF